MSEYLIMTRRYKRHFICFKCRKGFKQPNIKDLAERKGDLSLLFKVQNDQYYKKQKVSSEITEYIKKQYLEKEVLCPQCHTPMREVSLSFKVPPMKETRLWKNLEVSITALNWDYNHQIKRKKELIEWLECQRKYYLNMLQKPSSYRLGKESISQYRKRISQYIKQLEIELKKIKGLR